MAGRTQARDEAELRDALASSLDLRVALGSAYPLLRRVVPADAAALGVFPAAPDSAPQWVVDDLPPAFFDSYADMAAQDFVRDAVLARPSVVLRDDEMIARADLERHLMYRRARDVGAPLEQVMAVMLTSGNEGASGLALYRTRRRAFSDCERATLQRLSAAFAHTVRNCALHARALRKAQAFDAVDDARCLATVLVNARGGDLVCSDAARVIFERWFSRAEREGHALPGALAAALPAGAGAASDGQPSWSRRQGDHVLEASFSRLPSAGAGWLIVLDVRYRPAWCDALTPRERQVLKALAASYDNRLIAEELRCSVETIKKHVAHILTKACVADRRAFANQRYDL